MSLAYLGMDGRKTMGCLARISGFLHAGCNAGSLGQVSVPSLWRNSGSSSMCLQTATGNISVSQFSILLVSSALLLQTPQLAAGCHCGAHLSPHCIPTV